MTAREKKLGFLIFLIVLLSYILPYTMFRNVEAWYGSFLFWSILALVIIVINYYLTKNWGE